MKMTRKQWIIGGAAAAVVLVGAMMAFNGGTSVEMVKTERGAIRQTVSDTGYIESKDQIQLYASQSARVASIPVMVGQSVTRGQVLMIMDNPDLAAQLNENQSGLAQAEASLSGLEAALAQAQDAQADAKKELERTTALYNQGGVSDSDYDKAKLAAGSAAQSVKSARSALETARQRAAGLQKVNEQLSARQQRLSLASPNDGVVLALPVKAEAVVMPGTALATVGNLGALTVKADILSDDLGEVKLGDPVEITAPVLGKTVLHGTVTVIEPLAIEKQSALGVIQRRVPLTVSLDERPPVLGPGFEVRVTIITRSLKNAVLLPQEAVRTLDNGDKEVLAVVDGKVKLIGVTTGVTDQDNIQIVKGLKAGQVVVRDANQDLKEGTSVKPAKTE
ncbi:MAG: efflux RND transporter periplasmic adaptor subunit [Solirubrobacterales bacterium]